MTRWSLLIAGCVLTGCIELEELDPPSLVKRPRVLAVVAEPPEITPGQDTKLSILIGGADDYDVTWRACASYDGFVNNQQYAAESDDEGCSGRASLALGRGKTIVLPGALTAPVFEDLELAAIALGVALPADVLAKVRARVGMPFAVEATVRAQGETLRAIKRVLLSERPEPHENPPAPRFRFGNVPVTATDEPFVCAADSGDEVFVRAGVEVELAPHVEDGDGESWLEEFEVLDARGDLQPRTERAFYSWFTTGGSFSDGVTKSPLRNNLYRAPRQSGCEALWIVVRDGHGGTSACKLDVSVGERGACAVADAGAPSP
jgi:hypothetical protein